MDWLEFIASVVDAVAWPVAVLVGVLLVRKPVLAMLPKLDLVKYKELELQFGARAKALKDEATQDVSHAGMVAQPVLEMTVLPELARVSPRNAVIEAWRQVENAAAALARERLGMDFDGPAANYEAMRALERSEVVDPEVVTLMRDLRALRNEAAHASAFALDTDAALDFAEAAERVIWYLRELGRDSRGESC